MKSTETSLNPEGEQRRGGPTSTMRMAARRSLSRPVPIDRIAYSHPISQTILDPKTSRRIFELARDQQDELDPPEAEEDEEVIENDFTRPRTRDLEQLDDDDDDEGEEEHFQGDEEREFVRRLLGYIFFSLNWPTKQKKLTGNRRG
jgi:hypothetical protein